MDSVAKQGIFSDGVKIPVANADEAQAVLKRLYELGCGDAVTYKADLMSQAVYGVCVDSIIGVCVYSDGGLAYWFRDQDESYYANDKKPVMVLAELLRVDPGTSSAEFNAVRERKAQREAKRELLRKVGCLNPDALSSEQLALLEKVLALA